MAQVFSPIHNTLARLSLLAALALPAAIIVVSSAITRSPYGSNAKVILEQPVPFSHEHHATELGIDC
ncbi:MAG TPA: hypothetical protein VKT32_04425, partial [Chthonomonadaceae bacterium]|nr:hypothetical protein [Chthonomonadaceae bacterium]